MLFVVYLSLRHVLLLRFFGSNLRVLPVRNYAEMAKGMLAIAKVKTVISALDKLLLNCTFFLCACNIRAAFPFAGDQ